MHSQNLKSNTAIINRQESMRPFVIVGVCVLALVVSMYAYFVGKIVFDVVAHKQAETQIKLAQSSVGRLQASYLDQLRKIDLSAVAVSGLAESKNVLYASRTSDNAVVGMLQ